MLVPPSQSYYDLLLVGAGRQAWPLVDVAADGPGSIAALSDGTRVPGRVLLFASGLDWRRLEVAEIDDLLLGAGVYYGAGPSEALACTDSQVVGASGGTFAGPGPAYSVGQSPDRLAAFPQTGRSAFTNQPVGSGAPGPPGNHQDPVTTGHL